MGYEVVDPYSEEPLSNRPCETYAITGNRSVAGRFENLGLRLYHAEPGEQIPLKYHYHDNQEEGFYVLRGELHVETPEKEYTATEGEFFLVESGSPHRAFNPSDANSSVEALAFGAPTHDSGKSYDPDES